MTFLGIDVGTGSSKAVVANEQGAVLAWATKAHATSSPHPGWFEHDADAVWWGDVCALVRELAATADLAQVDCVAVSGIGPVALLTDADTRPVRPGILYGIDTRARGEIDDLTALLGDDAIVEHAGSPLTTQAVAPKLLWTARHEPDAWQRTRRWYSASNYLVAKLTGEYVLDHYSASTSDPLYDVARHEWWEPAWQAAAPRLERPRLAWPGEVVGTVTAAAAEDVGLPVGTPVTAGTIDALSEAYSVGCRAPGDTMIMYGSTLFFIETVSQPVSSRTLWSATGRTPDTFSIAAGMATGGLVTTWLAEILGADLDVLVPAAAAVPAGSEGLVLLPYFSGERTPIFDPRARGTWLGLTLRHTPAHLMRSALEGVAFGVRHNLQAMAEVGSPPRRVVAVGGGTRGNLWTQIVSDVTGMPQEMPSLTIGAAFGDARTAAEACAVDTSAWNPPAGVIEPRAEAAGVYDELFGIYRRTYDALRDDMHLLATLAASVMPRALPT